MGENTSDSVEQELDQCLTERVRDSLDFQFPMEQVIDPSESSLGQPPIVEQIVCPRELDQRSMGGQVEVAMFSPDHLEQEQEELLYVYSGQLEQGLVSIQTHLTFQGLYDFRRIEFLQIKLW